MTDPAALTDEELAGIIEVFRRALMVAHAGDWSMDAISDAAHICTNALHGTGIIAALRASRAEAERLREALDFYANPEHWESTLVREVPCFGPNAGASEWESGAAIDGGERARRALNVPLP